MSSQQLTPELFETKSLRSVPCGAAITRILAAAIHAVDPAVAVRRFLHRQAHMLIIGERKYDLRQYERVFLLSFGKASAAMAYAVCEVLGSNLTSGFVIVKGKQTFSLPHSIFRIFSAAHPIPDEHGVIATQQIVDLLNQTTAQDLVFVLISGGGSTLLTLPAPTIALADMQQLTTSLLMCGATINEINTLRKHLDVVKGGGLARIAAPATVISLMLSDVVGNPMDVIASGPTVPDPTTFADAYHVLERYGLLHQIPETIAHHIEAGKAGLLPDTPKPNDPLFERVHNLVVGSNQQAAVAAWQAAQREGFNSIILTTYAQGEARVVGQLLAAIARELSTVKTSSGLDSAWLPKPACIIVGGETTVTIRGKGCGGRNQEMALAAVRGLSGLSNILLVTLATDGEDGPTDAAGAIVTGSTLMRAQHYGLNPERSLEENDSYRFFDILGDLLRPGPTGTNVNDLAFVVAW